MKFQLDKNIEASFYNTLQWGLYITERQQQQLGSYIYMLLQTSHLEPQLAI